MKILKSIWQYIASIAKTLWNLHVSVITNNTGVSSKSYVMVMGVWIGWEVTQVMLILTVLDYLNTQTLNYGGITLLLGGLSGLILASAWGKTKTDEAMWKSQAEDDVKLPKPSEDIQ